MQATQIEQDARVLGVKPRTLKDALSRGTRSFQLARRMAHYYRRPMDDFRLRQRRRGRAA